MPDPTYFDGLVLVTQEIKHDSVSRPALITYCVIDVSAGNTAQQWADALQAQFATNFKDTIDSNAVLTQTRTLKGDGTSTFTTGVSTAAGTRGTLATTSLPPNCAVLIKKGTGFGGRNNRGRWYLPWAMNDNAVDETGLITGADLTRVQDDCNDWMTFWAGLSPGSTFTLAHREYDRPWDQPGRQLVSVEPGNDITTLVAEPIIATQRRRMPR
jgi:hypothetical protein